MVPVANDGLLPAIFAKVDPVTRIPVAGAWLVTIPIGLLAFFLDLEQITKIISIGNLLMYNFVSGCGIALRLRDYPLQRSPNELWVWAFLTVSFVAVQLSMKACPLFMIYPSWALMLYVLWRLHRLPQPNKPGAEEYSMPLVPVLPCLGMIGNYALIGGFDYVTWIYYGVYLLIGVVIYFGYGITHSKLD